MTIPTLILGLILSTLYGAAFHLWRGGGAGRLLLYLILGWIGFWTGHVLAGYWGWMFFDIGTLHVGFATVGSILFLGLGYWMSLIEVE